MSNDKFKILLCTNGIENNRPSLEYGVFLAGLLGVQVTLFGIRDINTRAASGEGDILEQIVAETEQKLHNTGVTYNIVMGDGRPEAAICAMANQASYLTIVGQLGRPAWQRWLMGRSFRSLLAGIETPIIYVPAMRTPIRRVLVCLGGLTYASSLARFSYHLARAAGASVILLHVVQPAGYDYPTAQEVEENWQHLTDTNTPQGHALKSAIEDSEKMGLKAEVRVVRGAPINVIRNEIWHGDYDLAGMGSPYSAHSLRHLYLPNVTAEVAEGARIPVLSVRYGHELELD